MPEHVPLTINNVKRDNGSAPKSVGAELEYLFAFKLSRSLTPAEQESAALKDSGLKVSAHGPSGVYARLTNKQLEANLERYQAAMEAIETEGKAADAASAEFAAKVQERRDNTEAQLQETLDRVNTRLKQS